MTADLRNPHALALVLAHVERPDSNVASVARLIGYSRPALSRYIHNSLPNPAKVDAAILLNLDSRACPHTGEVIEAEECRKRALAPRPFGGSARLVWWTTCQSCHHKPTPTESSPDEKEVRNAA